jgi:hypothetical protein
MENYPFDTCSLTGDIIDWYNETYKAIKAKFNIQFTGNINFQLEQFDLFRPYLDTSIRGSFAIKRENSNNDSYVVFVETHTKTTGVQSRAADSYGYLTWAIAYLKHDFGRVLIRRETLADKLIELVHPVELDFEEDKTFSDTFYILVNDRTKATMAIDRNFRNAVMDIRHEDFVIEINEHNLIIGSQYPITPDRAVYLAEFVSRVCSLC